MSVLLVSTLTIVSCDLRMGLGRSNGERVEEDGCSGRVGW